jgi:hypothetical protein
VASAATTPASSSGQDEKLIVNPLFFFNSSFSCCFAFFSAPANPTANLCCLQLGPKPNTSELQSPSARHSLQENKKKKKKTKPILYKDMYFVSSLTLLFASLSSFQRKLSQNKLNENGKQKEKKKYSEKKKKKKISQAGS